ncbi:radial spoke head 3 -like protein [Brachionus plicatilis]|uniref:Radial spoke head 3-like protein n=1 Tax=Brachionus plicatilis TaxID=10195 RepID=A0A3M7SHR8_BRAPC|nr:radial spoke head 3 -like protein [Brachionus plicatilis]
MAQVLNQNSSGSYTFSSQPRAVQQRKKYKEQWKMQPEDQLNQYGNIMYDRRVIRGNTYALNTLPATSQPDPIEIQRQQEERKRALARRRAKEQARRHTPEPIEGRKHIPIQTELYLEELSDRVEEVDVDVQTDAFLDRPPSPLFIPAKTGVDQATQILEGELFDFDREVKPILEVLVGKTIEQSLLEVMEEEELAALRKQQREYEELRNAEKVEQQRLEEQERRLREEKHRRMKQAADVLRMEKETAEKLAAKAFAKSYLADLVPSVFNNLRENGYFYDPVQRDLETGFMSWIMDSTMEELNSVMVGRLLLDSVLREVVAKRSQDYVELIEKFKEMADQPPVVDELTAQPINEETNNNLDTTMPQEDTNGEPNEASNTGDGNEGNEEMD